MSVYVCFCCGYPIIFRHWRGNPRQVFHIPTGWHCWNLRLAGVFRPGLPEKLRFPYTTSKKERRKLLDGVEKHYQDYLQTGNTRPITDLVEKWLDANKSDVVRALLADLVSPAEKRNGPLLRAIVASKGWKDFSRQLRAERLYADYRETGDAKPILQVSEALLLLGDLADGLELAQELLGLAENVVMDKAIAWFLRSCAYLFKGEGDRADADIRALTGYLSGLGEGFKVTEWDFSRVVTAVEERLKAEDRDRLHVAGADL